MVFVNQTKKVKIAIPGLAGTLSTFPYIVQGGNYCVSLGREKWLLVHYSRITPPFLELSEISHALHFLVLHVWPELSAYLQCWCAIYPKVLILDLAWHCPVFPAMHILFCIVLHSFSFVLFFLTDSALHTSGLFTSRLTTAVHFGIAYTAEPTSQQGVHIFKDPSQP